jgi:hypothetical protein
MRVNLERVYIEHGLPQICGILLLHHGRVEAPGTATMVSPTTALDLSKNSLRAVIAVGEFSDDSYDRKT